MDQELNENLNITPTIQQERLEMPNDLQNLLKKLTLKRIGDRTHHALSNVKMRKSGFDSFNQNRKHWSLIWGAQKERNSTYKQGLNKSLY